MNTGISPGAKWFTLCLPFFQYLFFHCKFTISISVSVCRCKSKVAQSSTDSAFFTLVPLLRGGANYLRKSFVEGIIVATFDAQIIKDNIKL